MRRVLIFLISFPILMGCSKDEWQGNVKIEDGVRIVHNPDEGIWDKKDGGKKLRLTPELSIGTLDGDESEILYYVVSVIADDEGNIYVCEGIDGHIKKFDESGNYIMTIGRNGSGPGELARPGDMEFDDEGRLWVVNSGNKRIEIFSKEGGYIDSIPIQCGTFRPAGIAIENDGTFFISYWDQDTDKTIHKYEADGTYVSSFGHSAEYSEPHRMASLSHKRNYAKGQLNTSKNSILYTQSNPFEICEFSKEGLLIMKVLRETDWMPRVKAEYGENESVIFRLPSLSVFIGRWKDYIVNAVWITPYVSEEIGTVVDLFDIEGRLLHSLKLNERMWPYYLDKNDKLYCLIRDENEVEKVVRYRLHFEFTE